MPSSVWSRRTVFGPTPGTRSISRRPCGTWARSRSWYSRRPVSASSASFALSAGAGAGDLRWLAALVERGDVVGVALDDVGHAAVGDRLVDDLAEDLEHVADLVEDPRQLRVADDGVAAARHAPGSGHRRPF